MGDVGEGCDEEAVALFIWVLGSLGVYHNGVQGGGFDVMMRHENTICKSC